MRNFLTVQEVVVLKEAHRATPFRKQADRIKVILFLNEGFEFEEIAKLLMLDDSTLRRYFAEFKEGGLDKLVDDLYKGSESFLTVKQQQELIVHLKSHIYQTAKEIVDYINHQYQVSYSLEGITHLLHKLGFVYKKTKVIPGKVNAQLQFEFIQTYQAIKENKGEEDRIYFLDSTHPIHNNMPSHGWILKGEEGIIKTNTGRSRLNITGALNLEDLDIKVSEYKTIDAQTTIGFLQNLEESQTEGILYCIADNARYYRNKDVAQFLTEHLRIKLIFLPPYSPNLNIIERLWLYFHQKVLYGHYYETFKEFKESTLTFFDNIQNYKEDLKTRLTDNFQIITV